MATFWASQRLTSTARKPDCWGACSLEMVHCWNLQHKHRKEALDQIFTSPDGWLSSVHCAVDVKAQVSVRVDMNRKTHICLAMPMAAYCTWERTYTILILLAGCACLQARERESEGNCKELRFLYCFPFLRQTASSFLFSSWWLLHLGINWWDLSTPLLLPPPLY